MKALKALYYVAVILGLLALLWTVMSWAEVISHNTALDVGYRLSPLNLFNLMH